MAEERQRIKEVRTSLNLSMEKFGDKLGVSRAAISRIESGVNSITEQMRLAICRTYGVSEEWLRTGQGEMFADSDLFSLDEYAKQHGANDEEIEILKAYFQIDEESRKTFLDKFLNNIAKNTGKVSNTTKIRKASDNSRDNGLDKFA